MSLAFTGGMVGWGSIASSSSPAGLHWQELGRQTLTGALDTIAVGLTGKWFEQDTSRFSVDTTNSEVDFSCGRDSSNNAITYDLGSNLSGTWVMRYVMNFSTNNASAENWFWVGLTDKDSSISTTGSTLDGFGGFIMYEQAIDAKERHGMTSSTASSVTEHQAYDTNVVFSTGTDYYCELIRTGTTTGTFTIRTGSHTGTVHNAYSYSGGNNATNLRYLRVSDLLDSAGGTGDMAGTLSAITIDDNATSYSSADYTVEFTKNPVKPYMMILSHNIVTSNHNMTWSTGTGSYSGDYSDRRSENGGSDLTSTSRATNGIISDAHTKNMFTVGNLLNTDGQEKLVSWSVVGHNDDGAGNAPDRFETICKFTGTSQINQMKLNNSSSINNEIGSEIVVLGYDPADTEGGSVWEELASVTLGSAGDTLDSGTFTAKKYLWIQYSIISSGSTNGIIRFNSDTGANYARRTSLEGAGDVAVTGSTSLNFGTLTDSNITFVEGFIINKSDKEKLVTGSVVSGNTAGAGNAPSRREGVGKWTNTSSQITSIQVINNGAGDINTGSRIKVWGFD